MVKRGYIAGIDIYLGDIKWTIKNNIEATK
jgi:hypothetical protein